MSDIELEKLEKKLFDKIRVVPEVSKSGQKTKDTQKKKLDELKKLASRIRLYDAEKQINVATVR